MAQPSRKLTDFEVTTDSRVPLPITNLPVNALAAENDPTKEIRSLIESLQQSARDARMKQEEAERERDNLAGRLRETMEELRNSRDREEEFRARFIEVTAVIRERDAAVQARDHQAQLLADLQRRFDAAEQKQREMQKEMESILVARDEAQVKVEALNRSLQATSQQLTETQRQVVSIRQARDTVQSRSLETVEKLQRAEDEIAELTFARESGEKARKQLEEELADLKRRLEAMSQDRDATAKQVEELSGQLDQERKRLRELAEKQTQAGDERQAALEDLKRQIENLTGERDQARNRAAELTHEVESLRADVQKLRDRQLDSEKTIREQEELRRQVSSLTIQLEVRSEREKELIREAEAARARLTAIGMELTQKDQSLEEALTSAAASKKETERLLHERDELRKELEEKAKSRTGEADLLNTRLQEQQKKMEEMELRMAALERERDDALIKARNFEAQRLEMIDLAAQLDNSRRDIVRLTADIAEARLQAKFAIAKAEKISEPLKQKSAPAPAVTNEPAAEAPKEDPAAPDATAAVEPVLYEPLTEREGRKLLTAMKTCFQHFIKSPSDASLLNELHTHVHTLAERARVTGYVALHRLSNALAELAHSLYQYPERINLSTLKTVGDTLEFFGVLFKQGDLTQLRDPAKATVYVVDDDCDNGQAISLAMETVALRTRQAQDAATAIAELATGKFDLIFLDIHMPEIDGFELCRQIRTLDSYRKTPIVFVTGLASAENRSEASKAGGSDFVAKPFHLHELSVKALTHILKDTLGLAG